MNKLDSAIIKQVAIVDEILERYINDEVGQESAEKFKSMNDDDKVTLLTNTLLNCSSYEDFETDLIINFDYCNY